MRTLIISDLHLGHWGGGAVLERPRPLQRLLADLPDFDRLVLLGDILEMRDAVLSEAVAVAGPILTAIGSAVHPDAEIVFLPGNHDDRMIRTWLQGQGQGLKLEGRVPNDASPLLTEFTGWLASGGAQVSVRYPGWAISDRVWITHGHYLDKLLVPEGPYGFGRRPRGPVARRSPAAYENAERRTSGGERMAHLTYKRVLSPRMSKLISRGLGAQMRRHSVPALRAVLGGLGVHADYVVFGHVHRNGPLGSEDWGDAPQLVNTGSWYFDQLLLNHTGPPDPYWPGGAAVIEEDGVPRPANLLEGLSRAELLERVR